MVCNEVCAPVGSRIEKLEFNLFHIIRKEVFRLQTFAQITNPEIRNKSLRGAYLCYRILSCGHFPPALTMNSTLEPIRKRLLVISWRQNIHFVFLMRCHGVCHHRIEASPNWPYNARQTNATGCIRGTQTVKPLEHLLCHQQGRHFHLVNIIFRW